MSPFTNSQQARATPVVARTTDHDRRAKFEALIVPHLDAAYALARWLTRNDADASDVVQDSFLRAFRYFDSYRGGETKAWLLKIVRRTCYDWMARNRPTNVISLDADQEEEGETTAVSVSQDAQLECRSDLKQLGLIVASLPAQLRDTIVLRELHQLGYREIAEVTGVPIGTVMSRLHRARSQLLHAMGEPSAACKVSNAQEDERTLQASSPGQRRAA
jgi:RNA polymerase sigma-70 factor (ECF subfamily)